MVILFFKLAINLYFLRFFAANFFLKTYFKIKNSLIFYPNLKQVAKNIKE